MELFSLKKDQKIIESLINLFTERNECGTFFAIGAVSSAILKSYDLEKKEYSKKQFFGKFEVCSLNGIVTRLENGDVFVHAHAIFSDENFATFGGHLEEGVVSATLEVGFVKTTDIKRKFDKEIGLNLLVN